MSGLTALVGQFARSLPPGRASKRLLSVAFVDSVGTGLFLAGSALFFTRALHLSVTQVGLGLSMSGLAGLLCSVPIGKAADRIGGLRTLVALQAWRGICFIAYPFVRGFTTFVLVACLVGAAEWAVGPITQAVVGIIEEGTSRIRTMAVMASVRNAGFTVGALLATCAISTSSAFAYRALVLVDAMSFLVTAAMLARLPLRQGSAAAKGHPVGSKILRLRNISYLLLSACNGALYLHTALLTVGIPLWIATQTHAPRTLVGSVILVNTLLVIVLEVRLSRGVDDVVQASRKQRWAGCSLALCCVLVSVTGSLDAAPSSVLLIVAMVALTAGEIWQSVGSWGLSYGLSPESQRSGYLSVYSLGATGATVVGPGLVTYAVVQAGPVGWLGLAAVFAAIGSVVPGVARHARRHAAMPG
ncbi:MFS transporter [Streptomyces sp. NPDC056190]|uniref:MFS transporter n=1 Tax=Streptomyces sp. NPDC056190 TaxID=3345741 RepID=UPI0035DBE9B1